MVAEENKLFVGGLPPMATEDELKQFAESYGAVQDVKIMIDRTTQRSRGFGFITFVDVDTVYILFYTPVYI